MKLPPIDEITSITQINEWIDSWIEECLHVNPKDPVWLYDENGYIHPDSSIRDIYSTIDRVTELFCKIESLNHKISGIGNARYTYPTYKDMKQWKSERISLYKELQELIGTPMSVDVDDNTSMPETHNQTDFSHMESFTPTFPFDMSKLYHFLIQEGVIRDIDKQLFSDCITHGHINELWENGVKSKLKLVCHRLKDGYGKEWFQKVCENLNLSAKDMGKFNLTDRKRFEQRLLSVIQKP